MGQDRPLLGGEFAFGALLQECFRVTTLERVKSGSDGLEVRLWSSHGSMLSTKAAKLDGVQELFGAGEIREIPVATSEQAGHSAKAHVWAMLGFVAAACRLEKQGGAQPPQQQQNQD